MPHRWQPSSGAFFLATEIKTSVALHRAALGIVVFAMAERRHICLFLVNEENDYQVALRQQCEQVARRFQMSVAVFSAENRSGRQEEQIRNAIAGQEQRRPDAVLVSPVSEAALLSLIHSAAQAGVAWVFLNRRHASIDDLRQQYPKVPVFSVSADQIQIGAVQGRQISMLLKPGDELLYIQGSLGSSSTKLRLKGMREQIPSNGMEMTSFNSDWTQAGGKSVMTQWLQMLPHTSLPSLVVAAQNDSMAAGAREAIVEWSSGRGVRIENVDIVGADGSPSFGQRMVSMGQLTATVVIPPVSGRALEELQAIERTGVNGAGDIQVSVEPFPSLNAMRSLRT